MPIIQIQPFSDTDMNAVIKLGCAQPGLCYANSILLVNVHKVADKYVLGLAADVNGSVEPHAWVKCAEGYYDPTLQAQGKHTLVRYDLRHEFDRRDIMRVLNSHYSAEQMARMSQGLEPLHPPAIDINGNIIFC